MGAREGWISRGQFPAVGSDDEVGDDEDGGGAVQEDMTDVDGGCRQKAARAPRSVGFSKPQPTYNASHVVIYSNDAQ